MKISFIGCPSSGKTTTAAMTFSSLKEMGIPCEFIPEQARWYIAKLRYHKKLNPEDPLVLTDEDQISIMSTQILHDHIVTSVVGPQGIVISDSSPLNSTLYMKQEQRYSAVVKDLVAQVSDDGLIFYAKPVPRSSSIDPNRIHDEETSLAIDDSIPHIMECLAPDLWEKVIVLEGQPKTRLGKVTGAILTHRFK